MKNKPGRTGNGAAELSRLPFLSPLASAARPRGQRGTRSRGAAAGRQCSRRRKQEGQRTATWREARSGPAPDAALSPPPPGSGSGGDSLPGGGWRRRVEMSRSAALLLCLLGCNVWKAVTKTLGAPEAAQGRCGMGGGTGPLCAADPGAAGAALCGGRTEGTAGKRFGDVRPLPAPTGRRRPRSPEKRRQPRGWGAFVTGRGRGCAGLIVLPPPFLPLSLGATGAVALRPFPPVSPLLTVPAAGPDAAVRGGRGSPAAAGRAGPPGWGSPPGLTARLGRGPGTFPGLRRAFCSARWLPPAGRGLSPLPLGCRAETLPGRAGSSSSSALAGAGAGAAPSRCPSAPAAPGAAPDAPVPGCGSCPGLRAPILTCAVVWQPLGRRGAPALQPSPVWNLGVGGRHRRAPLALAFGGRRAVPPSGSARDPAVASCLPGPWVCQDAENLCT